MVIANVLPRYGTLQHQRLGMMLIALFALSLLMLMPDMAFAAFDGTAKPSSQVGTNLDSSARAWWKFLSTPLFWVSMIWLAVCVLAFSGRGWQVPLILACIFLFGELVVDGFKSWMGGSSSGTTTAMLTSGVAGMFT
ncbi:MULTISPECIES: hypothetical protein [Pseudomonas]|uniref:hypothetical protein n=1 Tax=Pseudomonas TaxID=286 RepID=UPI00070C8543|nr:MULTISPECIES: hypothetical protein [Pseudomonas]KQW19842.1 hypothetical protein ASC85_08315 [Pseudomonas sp. Root401]WHS57427.1 hypothetical protein QLH64_30890 [Pseudomonas brassicacearum]WNZ87492.1 hypothetical protein QOM10_29860 [Pseudomonas sp. P108]